MAESPEGWGYPGAYALKRHYFVGGRSLCRRYNDILVRNYGGLHTNNYDARTDCATCTKKLEKLARE